MVLYEAGDLQTPRRKARRPVAGGLPAPRLEAWLELEEEEPREIPGYVWAAIGAGAMGLAFFAACGAVLAWWCDKILRGL